MKLNQISQETKLLTKTIINDYRLTDTKQMGFWLNNKADSDFLALAIFIEELKQSQPIKTIEDVVSILEKELPYSYFHQATAMV